MQSTSLGVLDVAGERIPNRLHLEKSPYLRQHAFNPVDWRPWGDDAFADAVFEELLPLLAAARRPAN